MPRSRSTQTHRDKLAIQQIKKVVGKTRVSEHILTKIVKTCKKSADPDRALTGIERLVSDHSITSKNFHQLFKSQDHIDLVLTLFVHSQGLAETVLRDRHHLDYLLGAGTLAKSRCKDSLLAEIQLTLTSCEKAEKKYDHIRRFRRRETMRIGARDLIGRSTLEETTFELANLADVCIELIVDVALDVTGRRFSLTPSEREKVKKFAVIGMGKLGGQELNYSSDVDVMFVYAEEGVIRSHLSYHEYFTKLAEEIIFAVGSRGNEGQVYRIDLRLRPEGATGPLVRSLDSCENYYAQWGETWERMALIKARHVAGSEEVGVGFIQMLQPFIYARHTGQNIIQEMAAIKNRIEQEVDRHGQLDRHVKLGVGGIREIEFIVQAFQILHGARVSTVRERNTLLALKQLAISEILDSDEADALADAYRFLRTVEHRLQMEMDLQTHTIPNKKNAIKRLARSIQLQGEKQLHVVQRRHMTAVRSIYDALLAETAKDGASELGDIFSPTNLRAELAKAEFDDLEAAAQTIEFLLHGPGFGHISTRTKELFGRLFPILMRISKRLVNSNDALGRFEKFVSAYGSRGLLYETFYKNPRLLDMLLRICDASKFFSDTITLQPELFDAICRGEVLSEPKDLPQMEEELQLALNQVLNAAKATQRKNRSGVSDTEDFDPWLESKNIARKWKRSELLRVGIEDIAGFTDLSHGLQEITWLAEACLQFALGRAREKMQLKKFPFAIIGLGKFGGQELGYGADLDVLFVGGRNDTDQQHACKLSSSVISFMDSSTSLGSLFPIDARLRPDGEQGSLASPLKSHKSYYEKRAQFWEWQALTKARYVAGDVSVGIKFIRMIHSIIYSRAINEYELEQVRKMRFRIETERGDQANAKLEFKVGPGGLLDVEFGVQVMQLRYGYQYPQLRIPHTLAVINRLAALGLLRDDESFALRKNYIFLRRIESILRRMENTSISKLPSDERQLYLLSKRIGCIDLAHLTKTYDEVMRQNREIYQRIVN